MKNSIKLNKHVTSKILLDFGFKTFLYNRYIIHKNLYGQLIFLRMEIDLNEKEVSFDVIDRNTQETYYPFWYNYNEERNLVALEVIDNFNNFVKELQDKKILKIVNRKKRNNNEKNCKIFKSK